jgi:hypothetical protein
MTANRKNLIVAVAVSAGLIACFALGRYSKRPETRIETKVETKVETKYVDRIQYVEREVKKHVVTTTTKKPTGEVVTQTVADTHVQASGTTDTKASSKVESKSEQKVVTTVSRPNWAIGAGGKWDSSSLKPDHYAASVDRRILGPAWLSVTATTDKTVTALVKLEF